MMGRLPIAKMLAATLALTAVISAVMLPIRWNGQGASTAAPDIDRLLDVMIVLSAFVFALVMPSTFPEAFGMVAAEAAACGALPVSAAHSGMLEVSRQLATALPAGVGPLTSFPAEEGAVGAIAERLNAWLSMPERERAVAREALVDTARRLWSWEGVARGVIAASRGDLDHLPLA